MSGAGPRTRSLWGIVWRNFVSSFKFKPPTTPIGSDLYGNKFFERAADPRKGKRHPERWFDPPEENRFDSEYISPEWEAWLRLRRTDPPTAEEIEANIQMANLKKINAAKIALKEGRITSLDQVEEQKHTDMHSFPTYEEYEVNPGKGMFEFEADHEKKKKTVKDDAKQTDALPQK